MMTPSKILFFFCLSFIFGIFLQSLIKIPQSFLWVFLFFAILIFFLSFLVKLTAVDFTRKAYFTDLIVITGFCLLFMVLGVLRAQISEFNVANDKLSKLNNNGQVVLIGEVSGEPDIRNASQKLKINANGSVVLVTTSRYPEYKYLDKLKITGKLETPSETEDFSYKNYLLKDGIYSVMNFPKIELISKNHQYTATSFIYEKILFFKQKLRESIRKNFSPPHSLILEGTILGDNGVMTQDLKNKLNITGLRHIIAVSGTHIVILSAILMSLLLAFGFWRGQAFYFSIIFIWLYILLTGLPASGVRAGIMGSIFLLSQKLGRQNKGSRVIVLAGAIMLLQNPLLLIYDVGFQLSFLAVLGLIYLEPLINNFIKYFTHEKAKNFISIVSTTFAAQIFTLPIMIYNFGNISFVSPITNLLILPIVYWLMVFGFLSSILGIFSNILGWIISIPCLFLLSYFIKVIDIFSQPWMIKNIQNVSWIWPVALYIIIALTTFVLNKRMQEKFLG